MSETNTKGRLLFLEHYLLENTDDEHLITTDELIKVYEKHGFKANRNTIHDDIRVLKAADVDVISVRVGNAKGYHIGSRLFETAELKTLADAVSSSRFITLKKSEALIKKLSELTSSHNREQLRTSAFMTERLKTESSGIFNTIDVVNAAISSKKKISFQYIDYTADKEVILRHDGKIYTVSPYAFLWNDDRCYVPSYSEEKGCIIPFRIDRMRNVRTTEEPIVEREDFDPAEYRRKVIKMYDGSMEECMIKLAAENRFMLNVIDRFGEDVHTEIIDDEHFAATVVVAPSSTFFSWVTQFCGSVVILSPEKVICDYKESLDKIMKKHDDVFLTEYRGTNNRC